MDAWGAGGVTVRFGGRADDCLLMKVCWRMKFFGLGGKIGESRVERMVFGGGIGNYDKEGNELSGEEYAEKVVNGEMYDGVMRFELKKGFEFRGIMGKYLWRDGE